MEAAAYRRMLLRLLAVPIVALALLASLTVYGFRQVQHSARRLDRSDQVLAQTNNLVKLMIDQETNLIGFMLTRNPTFLQTYRQGDAQLDQQYAAIFKLIRRDSQQTARLQRLQGQSRAWQQAARDSLAHRVEPADLAPTMLERNRQMVALRASAGEFLDAEAAIRANRSSADLRIDNLSLYSMLGVAALVGLFLAWDVYRLVGRLTLVYNRQLREATRRGEESYAREQWLNTTLRSIGDAVIACDPDGKVVFMNGVAERLTDWKEGEAHGLSLLQIFPIFHQQTREVVENPVDKVRRVGAVVGMTNHTVLVSRSQKEFIIDDSAAPILDASARMIGIVLVFRDVTERYAAERALVRTEKLASAGRLAASIAHEVNNPLEGLVNLVYLARREENLENVRQHLTQADIELQRIAHITRQSLGFYRENASAGLFRPDTVVRQVFDFYSFRAASAHITLHVNIQTEQKAFGNAGELRQVISNLLANSLDACSAGSAICVRLYAPPQARDSAGVRIVFADTGSGISPKYLKTIFEPFFTTKKDTGTGLGLWVSRELIEKTGGRLRVRSRSAGDRTGTVFSIWLPGGPVNE